MLGRAHLDQLCRPYLRSGASLGAQLGNGLDRRSADASVRWIFVRWRPELRVGRAGSLWARVAGEPGSNREALQHVPRRHVRNPARRRDEIFRLHKLEWLDQPAGRARRICLRFLHDVQGAHRLTRRAA